MAEVGRRAEPKFTLAMVALIPFANAFAQRGGDVERVLTKNRIPIGALSEPAMLVEANACYAAMEDMADLLGDPFFGARLAIEAGKTGTPAIREAAAKAATLGDFLSRFIVEIANQVDNVEHRVEVSSQAASFELRRKAKPRGATTQVTAVNIAFFVTLFQTGLGNVFDPVRITVLAPSTEGVPADLLPKRTLLKSRLNGIRLIFPVEWFWAPFSLAWKIDDARKGEACDDDRARMLVHFRSVIADNIGQDELSVHRFADLVGLHPRRVQRLLSAYRTSYRKLKEDVRCDLARNLLTDASLPVTEIASSIGFSDVSAFDRAFKQWTGKTPTEYRQQKPSHYWQ